jgi:hypothetical protein
MDSSVDCLFAHNSLICGGLVILAVVGRGIAASLPGLAAEADDHRMGNELWERRVLGDAGKSSPDGVGEWPDSALSDLAAGFSVRGDSDDSEIDVPVPEDEPTEHGIGRARTSPRPGNRSSSVTMRRQKLDHMCFRVSTALMMRCG